MTTDRLLAVDPGTQGGLAWLNLDGEVCACPMPEGMTAQADLLRSLSVEMAPAVAIVEKVGGYMPGNSGPAAATFARHCGHLEAALYLLGVPVEQVTPAKWMRETGTWPKDKGERKRAIREAMARRFPHIRVTLRTADALALLVWARQRHAPLLVAT